MRRKSSRFCALKSARTPTTENEGWMPLRDIAWEIGMGDTRAGHVSLRRAAKSLAKKGLLQIQPFNFHVETEGRYRWLLAVRLLSVDF
jgi:hypothetical protein